MKKLLLTTALAAGLAGTVYGQGVILKNSVNIAPSSAATSGGMVWTNNNGHVGLFDGINYNLGLTILGGSDTNSLSPIASYNNITGSQYTGDSAGHFLPFGFSQGSQFNVPNVAAGGLAWIEIQAWVWEVAAGGGPGGPWSTYAAAQAHNALTGFVLFQNPTGNPLAGPPIPAQQLTGMPALVLTTLVPEPSTLALAGLGAAALLAIRRRK